MAITAKNVADIVGGKVIGNLDDQILGVSKIQESKPGDLTFLYLPAYSKYLPQTKASVILVTPEEKKIRQDITYIEVEKPDVALQLVVRKLFNPTLNISGIDKTAAIAEDANIGKNVTLGKNVVISPGCEIGDNSIILHNVVLMDNVKVGSNTLIYPNTTVREDCVIGSGVIIHSGSVIGSDGFGYSPRKEGGYDKVPQIGNVILEDDVEIGSNVSIDRAAMGSTIIRKGCKIDNLVQIAHNVEIGDDTAVSSQVGIAGSTKIGKNCILAGQVGIVGHIEIADGVMLGAQSGVSKSLLKPGKYFGYPAKEMGLSLRQEGHLRNLPKYADRIKQLESELKILKSKIIELTGDE